ERGSAEQVRPRAIRDALYRPRHLPTASGLVIATDGSILIRREDRGRETVNWTVLSPTGKYVADQTAPAATRFMAAGGPYFYGVERDEDGVITIARYRAVEQ
ncbi:MAG: hypothetical protein ACREMA_15615, partial [Longimicrobiales bacterium]